jgi:cereblon
MTFRTLDEDEVSLSGRAETRDTWFPGYSWTIMSCGFCLSHLGWKFQCVDESTPATEDRPLSFYGLSTSQVTTVVPELARARRRPSRGPFRH